MMLYGGPKISHQFQGSWITASNINKKR